MKIYLSAIIKAKPEYQKEVEDVLLNMVEQTRKEEACIKYDLHQDLSDPNTYIFYEVWANQEGLNNHNQFSYIKDFGELISTKLQEQPIIHLMQKI